MHFQDSLSEQWYRLNTNSSIYTAYSNYLVHFETVSGGGESDLDIYDQSNSKAQSYSNIGNTYQAPLNITVNTEASRAFLAGTYNFITLEIEVYTSNKNCATFYLKLVML